MEDKRKKKSSQTRESRADRPVNNRPPKKKMTQSEADIASIISGAYQNTNPHKPASRPRPRPKRPDDFTANDSAVVKKKTKPHTVRKNGKAGSRPKKAAPKPVNVKSQENRAIELPYIKKEEAIQKLRIEVPFEEAATTDYKRRRRFSGDMPYPSEITNNPETEVKEAEITAEKTQTPAIEEEISSPELETPVLKEEVKTRQPQIEEIKVPDNQWLEQFDQRTETEQHDIPKADTNWAAIQRDAESIPETKSKYNEDYAQETAKPRILVPEVETKRREETVVSRTEQPKKKKKPAPRGTAGQKAAPARTPAKQVKKKPGKAIKTDKRGKATDNKMPKKILGAIAVIAVVLIGGIVVSKMGGSEETKVAEKTTVAEKNTESKKEEKSNRAEIMSTAQTMALGYDYDGAIELLQTIKGWDSDSEIKGAIAEYTKQKDACVAVDVTKVPHIFYHSLVNKPEYAFDVEVRTQLGVDHFNAWMTTVEEFDKITQEMYDRGYVYVRLRDLVIETTDADGNVHFEPNTHLMLPPDKKPVVLSVDDLSYYHTYETASYPDKLIVDENGDVKCHYVQPDGTETVGDYDVVPRLNTFLTEHPDGAYKGARGLIALTGYNGVLGYRTDGDYLLKEHLQEDQAKWLEQHPDFDWEKEREEATKVADAVKESGWEFASHTWGHINVTDKPLDAQKIDNGKWKKYVASIVGDVDTMIFAFGNDIGQDVKPYTMDNPKFAYYKSAGYNYYCNIDSSIPYYVEIKDNYVRQSRINFDGYRMYEETQGHSNILAPFFDANEVFDGVNRPTPVNPMG